MNKNMTTEKIKPALHVNGNIVVERDADILPINSGGGIICYVSTECVDLSDTVVIEGDLRVRSLCVRGRSITCSGDYVCLQPSEEAVS